MNETFEWDIRVPLVSNVYVLVDILIVLLLVSGALMAVVLYATGFADLYGIFRIFLWTYLKRISGYFQKKQPVFCPSGKPGVPQLLRYQEFAVDNYSFTLSALNMRHPRLLQHQA